MGSPCSAYTTATDLAGPVEPAIHAGVVEKLRRGRIERRVCGESFMLGAARGEGAEVGNPSRPEVGAEARPKAGSGGSFAVATSQPRSRARHSKESLSHAHLSTVSFRSKPDYMSSVEYSCAAAENCLRELCACIRFASHPLLCTTTK